MLLNIQNGKWEKKFQLILNLMNKIFELVEAQKFFNIPKEKLI